MKMEDQHTDHKSLRSVTGKAADWDVLARACVCFANGAGGRLLIGSIKDKLVGNFHESVPVYSKDAF